MKDKSFEQLCQNLMTKLESHKLENKSFWKKYQNMKCVLNSNQMECLTKIDGHSKQLNHLRHKFKEAIATFNKNIAVIDAKLDEQLTIDEKLDVKLTLLQKSLTQRYYHIQQISHQLKTYPKRFRLPTYDIGAEANPAHFAPIITNEITILEIKELKLNDAAFVLSNKKWTYALLVGKEKNQQDGTFTCNFKLSQDCIVTIQAQSEGEWKLLSQTVRLVKHY